MNFKLNFSYLLKIIVLLFSKSEVYEQVTTIKKATNTG